ncbi:ATP-binding cassette domain-containing protein [Acinetobacter shaoyimingii]|uniref:ABC transporter ATP-binding protein n=1 Tax=Acinetobacter shaoyimingii TaxID=2715164 RepID=A0A6G8RUE7_9GAMM|nr:ABC transporter ATP-binding protein [Acinetobacter shaoyimingii]QIO05511.1 ABC transporter ATP-binding protein [Acinetobacter shaoyimingii]
MIAIVSSFLLVSTVIGVLLPYLLKLLIDESQSSSTSQSVSLFSFSNLYFLAFAYAMGWLISQAIDQFKNMFSALFFRNFESALVYKGLENYFNLKYEEQKKIEAGVFNADLWRGASGFSQITYTILFVIIPIVIQIIGMVWVLAHNIGVIYSLYFLIFSIITLALSLLITFKTHDIFTAMYESRNSLNQFIIEKISGAYDIKVNASLNYELKEFDNRIHTFKRKAGHNYKKAVVFMLYQLIFIGFFLLFFMLLSVYLFQQKQQITAGDFVLISTYIVSLTLPLMMMSQSIIRLRGDFIAAQKYYDYFNLQKDELSQKQLNQSTSLYEFRHSNFMLGQYLVHDFNFKIEHGKCYVAIGRTGIGKTSFIHYLIGLQQIQKGQLKYKDVDISEQFSAQIFKEIAFVSQNPIVYSGTLRQNLVHNSQYNYSDQDLYEWLDRFHLTKILHKNNIQLDDDLQDIYKSFSGGEKQRISIIRAMLKRPELLIMDEPTAALDERTSLELMPFIRKRVPTIFMISHANYALEFADEIIDFNQLIVASTEVELDHK